MGFERELLVTGEDAAVDRVSVEIESGGGVDRTEGLQVLAAVLAVDGTTAVAALGGSAADLRAMCKALGGLVGDSLAQAAGSLEAARDMGLIMAMAFTTSVADAVARAVAPGGEGE